MKQFEIHCARLCIARAVLAGTLPWGAAFGLGLVAAPGAMAAASPAVSAPIAVSSALVQAYVAGRHLPAGSVAGIRAGSLHTASVSGMNWAIAEFTPSASAAPGVQAEFQDGAGTGTFSQRPPGPWRLAHTGPYGCGRGQPGGEPADLRRAWSQRGLPAPVICPPAMTTQRGAASAALAQGALSRAARSPAARSPAARSPAARSRAGAARTLGQSIARIALGQVGVGDTPAVTSFAGVDCDPYSALVGALSPNAEGCGVNQGVNPGSGLADENEAWCSDFAKWVWQQAGVTAGVSTLNAGSGSFYDWGLAAGETMPADGGQPAAGDAVVFFPPGRIASPAYGDHVGIVTAVNPDGTVNLVNGDFLGASNISVQYDTKVRLTSWAAQIWGPGEQWVLVAPPGGAQPAAPAAVISGPQVAVAGTAVGFSARATVPGGVITGYQWTFGDGRTANQGGAQVSTVFPGAGIYPVTMTATSSLGAVVTRTWDVDVTSASSAVTSIPSNAVWYSTTPVGQVLVLPAAGGGLAAESTDGGPGWQQQAIPGQASAGSGLTALAYPDPAAGDAMTPHAYFRSATGMLAETYLGRSGWTTQTLAGQPGPGSALAATTQAGAGSGPAVFYFNAAGQLSQTDGQGTSWATSTLSSGPGTSATGSLALADTSAGAAVFYLGGAADAHGRRQQRSRLGGHVDLLALRCRRRHPAVGHHHRPGPGQRVLRRPAGGDSRGDRVDGFWPALDDQRTARDPRRHFAGGRQRPAPVRLARPGGLLAHPRGPARRDRLERAAMADHHAAGGSREHRRGQRLPGGRGGAGSLPRRRRHTAPGGQPGARILDLNGAAGYRDHARQPRPAVRGHPGR